MVVVVVTVVLVWYSSGCLLPLWLPLSLFFVVSVELADVMLVVVLLMVLVVAVGSVFVRLVLVTIVLSVSLVAVVLRGRGANGFGGPC